MAGKLNRRDFLKAGIATGIVAVSGLNPSSKIFANSDLPFDLVAVKGGEADDMFDKGIEALGGMSKFVKKGHKVVVKPNIGWDVSPERAGNTNPKLVKRIIEHCFKAGAKDVYVFDHTCDDWRMTYKTSGIEYAVKSVGGKIVSGASEKYYRKITFPKGKSLKEDKVHQLILDSDVYINVPILKNHGSAKLTMCLKNQMGCNWDRRYWHKNDLQQCIADFATRIKPDLNIVDAYRIMQTHGPRGVSVEDVTLLKAQIISTDMVAADAAATKFFGLEPKDIPHVRIAHEMGIGNMEIEKLRIKRIRM
ncbi:MAG: DUF362 domain-containing protein [bacterium]